VRTPRCWRQRRSVSLPRFQQVAYHSSNTGTLAARTMMTDWIAEERRYLFQNYGRQPIVIERGEGTRVWDTEGREYLDFVGGLAVTSLGHAHPVLTEAVAKQASTLIHMSNLFYTTPMIELAKLLVEHSCL